MKFLMLWAVLAGLGLVGCASDSGQPVAPKSEESDMPWNPPLPGEGGGQVGSMLGQGR